jgi:thiol-disulfide isomerase/thioredoxin
MKNHVHRLILLASLAALVAGSLRAQSALVTNLTLDELDGTVSNLNDYLSIGPVYITFWALWCEPCKQELRALKSFVEEHKDEPFTILAVNQDSPKSLAKVKAYVRSQGYRFPVIMDPNMQVFQAFNGLNIPFSVLLDRNGKEILKRSGYLPGDEKDIGEEILRLLYK